MPIIKSAIKKMRQDKTREAINRRKKTALKKVVKNSLKLPSVESLSKAFSALDRAAKGGLIPKGRANRQKSRLAKQISAEIPLKTKPSKLKTKKTSKPTK